MGRNGRTVEKKGIVLMGMKHSGKSTLGRALAETQGMSFVDLDDLVELGYDPARSKPVREIYQELGPEGFHSLERQACARLVEMMESMPLVAALGGGTVEHAASMDLLSGAGFLVYLEESLSVLFPRIMARGRPAFLSESDPLGDFEKVFDRRTALYRERADLTIHLEGRDVEAAFSELVRALSEVGYAG